MTKSNSSKILNIEQAFLLDAFYAAFRSHNKRSLLQPFPTDFIVDGVKDYEALVSFVNRAANYVFVERVWKY